VLLAIGVAGSSAYETVRESRLRPGDSMTVAGNRLVFRGYESRLESNHRSIRALVDVYRGGAYLGRYKPGKNQYFAEDQVSNEASIRHDLLTGGDLFLIADQVNSDGSVDLKALQKPLVNLIWLAGFVFVGGSLIALWPDAREERRLAERYAGAAVRI
jgi:cytochrome c biogenesis factor